MPTSENIYEDRVSKSKHIDDEKKVKGSDIQRKVLKTLTEPTPTSHPAHQKAAHTVLYLLGSTQIQGEYRCSVLGEYSHKRGFSGGNCECAVCFIIETETWSSVK